MFPDTRPVTHLLSTYEVVQTKMSKLMAVYSTVSCYDLIKVTVKHPYVTHLNTAVSQLLGPALHRPLTVPTRLRDVSVLKSKPASASEMHIFGKTLNV